MKTRCSFLLTLIVLGAALSGCSLFSKYSKVEYNDLIVESFEQSAVAIEETATLYNETIPEEMTEQDEIQTEEMKKSYKKALSTLEDTDPLLTLESRDLEQQSAVRTELEVYRSAAELYLESYAKMLEYYGTEAYKEDITQVEIFDENLHTEYTTFIEANNDLVDILLSFVTEEE